jgi:NAD(P)-dependent dehydrogenase (short-subunit alcohol dehydrogenase family)
MNNSKQAVLVTGTSTGNGHAIALTLDKAGYTVIATVRNEKDAQEIRNESSERLHTIFLDITSQTSISNALEVVNKILINGLELYAIVNNAGMIMPGPQEVLAQQDWHDLFDLNFFGHIEVTKQFLPLLRQSQGKIINIASVAGRISFPLMGSYSASKYAIIAISDAFRIELAKWGISVITIEPGAVKTPGWVKFENKTNELYKNYNEFIEAHYKTEFGLIYKALKYQSIMQTSPERVAAAVLKAVKSRRYRTRYRIGFTARLLNFSSKFIPYNRIIYYMVLCSYYLKRLKASRT